MMVTIDLEENDDCIMVDKTEVVEDVKKSLNFKKKLILKVRKHRSLYDNKHKMFSNVAKKELVWQQIAEDLKVNVDVCKDIWIDLRYRYQCHARRLRKHFTKNRKENSKRPFMRFESELMFLWRFIENRKTCNLQFEITENGDPHIEIESELSRSIEITPAEELSSISVCVENNTVEKESEIEVSKDNNTIPTTTPQKPVDDDLILVEQPVELIVIDEDDDNGKSEKQFKVTANMKSLINQIKNYPELYDSENLAFKDYNRKSYIWNAIAGNLCDKATKLMKCWILMQTRYEWELWQSMQNTDKTAKVNPSSSELLVQLEFLRNYILNNSETVYKQSYYLKTSWFDPIDYFKDIYNLIVRMKKMSDIVYITDTLLKTPEKSKQYLTLWTEIANLKGCTAGQCETTWLIMRHFYWEIMNMRRQNYQLTDKWYFENIITELYAISKAAQTAKEQELQVLKQMKPTKKGYKRQSTPTPTEPRGIFPKITSAVSLAPQVLNPGTLQITQIACPPSLSPAPNNSVTMSATNPANPPSGIIPTQTPFNVPNQTSFTTVPLPQFIRTPITPIIPATTQTSLLQNNSRAVKIAPVVNSGVTTINSTIRPQMSTNIMPAKTTALATPPALSSLNLSNCARIPVQTKQSVASHKITTHLPANNTAAVATPSAAAAIPTAATAALSTNSATNNSNHNDNNTSIQVPKISGAVSLLNPNEILIELISSQNGNQLVVHGPPLSAKYQLNMPTVAKFIREVLAIPLLHNKRNNQPSLINYYWEHIAGRFNLPVHICRACWNFLLENFNHFPQIAPLKELMRPFQTSLSVWKESTSLFQTFDEHCVSKGWLQYMTRLPEVMECVSGYPMLYQDVRKKTNAEKFSDMEMLLAWRTISLRFPKIPEIQEIWRAFKIVFCKYMTDLEFGVDNKWPINWWRALARLKFLVEAKYSQNEPFYYIISNKMVEEIDKCAMTEMRNRNKNADKLLLKPESENMKMEMNENNLPPTNNNDIMPTLVAADTDSEYRKHVELGALLTAINKQPIIYQKSDTVAKYEAWKKVAQELNMDVTDCLLAFKNATQTYFAYKKQDPVSRCRINEKYYKKFDEIIRSHPSSSKFLTSRCKLNIKTPFELNKSVEVDGTDLVFPERYISDISMSNSDSQLVVKNWVYAIGNLGTHFNETSNSKLRDILYKYLKNAK